MTDPPWLRIVARYVIACGGHAFVWSDPNTAESGNGGVVEVDMVVGASLGVTEGARVEGWLAPAVERPVAVMVEVSAPAVVAVRVGVRVTVRVGVVVVVPVVTAVGVRV